jgi:hypothetical protein
MKTFRVLIGGMAAAGIGLTNTDPSSRESIMRFYLQQNVMCLAYEHPLLLERSRGWAPKNHFQAGENPQCPPLENDGAMTTVEPEDFTRWAGEGGREAPGPAMELTVIPLETAIGRRSDAP